MSQCPVPAVPQPPIVLVRFDQHVTDDQVAEFQRQFAMASNGSWKMRVLA